MFKSYVSRTCQAKVSSYFIEAAFCIGHTRMYGTWSIASWATAVALVSILLLPKPGAADFLQLDAGRGPLLVSYPPGNDADHPAPLLILLHGFTGTGQGQEAYFRLLPLMEREGFIYVAPDGTANPDGNQFWNATPACCDFYRSGVDDSGYLLNLVAEIRRQLFVDPWRVHFVGHSNGGFMSYRMACDHADVLASLTSLAGSTFDDPADCDPQGPVHVLQIHGTLDDTILYPDGGQILGIPYPGAMRTAEIWAAEGNCSLTPDASAPWLDLDSGLPGLDTEVWRYEEGCDPASSAELWTLLGGGHVPQVSDGFREGVVGFAKSHRKAGVVFTDKETLEWPPLQWAQEYRVYRGSLEDLVDTDDDGLPDGGYGSCISDRDADPTDTVLRVDERPGPNRGWFYVVGFVEPDSSESILGTTSSGRSRWPEQACP